MCVCEGATERERIVCLIWDWYVVEASVGAGEFSLVLVFEAHTHKQVCVCVCKDLLARVYNCSFIHARACSCTHLSPWWKPEISYSRGGLICEWAVQWRLLRLLIKCTRQKPEFLLVFRASSFALFSLWTYKRRQGGYPALADTNPTQSPPDGMAAFYIESSAVAGLDSLFHSI